MASDASVFGLSILGVVVGLVILLWGAEHTNNVVVAGGGIVVLSGVGLMTSRLARMDGPAEGH